MISTKKRPLQVFLCHSSSDKPAVRALYRQLVSEGIDAWLDEEKLLPGQDWQFEIAKAVRNSDAVIVCLSNDSVSKEGYVQKEIKFALDVADEKPEGTIYIIPVKLEQCDVPNRLSKWQWLDLFYYGFDFDETNYKKLWQTLYSRAKHLNLRLPKKTAVPKIPIYWHVYRNDKYKFEFSYPSDARMPVDENQEEHDHYFTVELPFTQETNLHRKSLEVRSNENSGPCVGPMARGMTDDAPTQYVTLHGIQFSMTNETDVHMGTIHEWISYCTSRNNLCVCFTFIFTAGNPGAYYPAIVEFDRAAEGQIFSTIMSTFKWLGE